MNKKSRSEISSWLNKQLRTYDWKLLVFLILVLNVKLVVKLLAIVLCSILYRKEISLSDFFKNRSGWLYISMIIIGGLNFIFQIKSVQLPYIIVTGTGVLFWVMSLMAVYLSKLFIEKADVVKLEKTITLFFILHSFLIFANLLQIIWITGNLNPYTFKGFNQKYYLSTGDSIFGITFDSPVTTATIAAFGVLFFLYRSRLFLSIISMLSLLIMFSNLTNIFLLVVLVFVFMFRSSLVQKSMIFIYMVLSILFISKVSPQNNEYVVSFVYKLIGKAYYLPPVKIITNDDLKHMPDSVLSYNQRRQKVGLLYIDSLNGIQFSKSEKNLTERDSVEQDKKEVFANKKLIPRDTGIVKAKRIFNEYRPTAAVAAKESRFAEFLKERLTQIENDSLHTLYDWEKPGKEIAYKETFTFLKTHRLKALFGAGIGNFSSRIAFKSAALDIAGAYPVKYRYIHPLFLLNHLYIYLTYHAQWQIKHSAANTPDSVYNQILGEYGLVGLVCFILFFGWFYLKRSIALSFAFPLVAFLLAAFLVEYWFEQLSIVILFEVLFLVDLKMHKTKEVVNE